MSAPRLTITEGGSMTPIDSDGELRKAIEALDESDRRALTGLFLDSVLPLTDDPRTRRAAAVAKDADSKADELEGAYHDAKQHAIETHTVCGRDADWMAQAEHFVAAAAVAALVPERSALGPTNLAWKAAMHARIARSCEMIAVDSGDAENEIPRPRVGYPRRPRGRCGHPPRSIAPSRPFGTAALCSAA
jgi:hypothetical protein